MKRFASIIVAFWLIMGCGRLPEVVTDPTQSSALPAAICQAAFPKGDWQLQHAIDASIRGRPLGRLIGALIISSRSRTIECALMTIEGLVLFSARYDGRMVIQRAVKPFDRPGFAQGLVDDLMLMFLQPDANGIVGVDSQGKRICRHRYPESHVIDVVIDSHNGWIINKYNTQGKLLRTVKAGTGTSAQRAGRTGIAQHMTLENRSGSDYRLELKLIEAIPLQRASE